ncbi:hypothetical protein HOLleu_02137 [Holothuria leucospilota]|uniref:Uncharacterized protein n=1 Tax=Holothuria leucospilota TaxID=206669 RepID=A0A9Q1CRY3_HOLLE|nr:hypothetical protein HOLleu_02137 [Holothuria leucospilota]
MKTINYLDVTLDLTSGQYYPYSKPNSIPLYVNSKSNHPPQIIRNLPSSINRRLSDLSSNEAVFNKVAPTYQQALNDSKPLVQQCNGYLPQRFCQQRIAREDRSFIQ